MSYTEPKDESSVVERIIGTLAAGLAGWILQKTGLEIGVEGIVTLMLGVYGIVHKLARGLVSRFL